MVYATSDGKPAAKLRVGMVGGGRGAFIVAVHRLAMRLDDRIALVAGALSSDAVNAAVSGAEIGLWYVEVPHQFMECGIDAGEW